METFFSRFLLRVIEINPKHLIAKYTLTTTARRRDTYVFFQTAICFEKYNLVKCFTFSVFTSIADFSLDFFWVVRKHTIPALPNDSTLVQFGVGQLFQEESFFKNIILLQKKVTKNLKSSFIRLLNNKSVINLSQSKKQKKGKFYAETSVQKIDRFSTQKEWIM